LAEFAGDQHLGELRLRRIISLLVGKHAGKNRVDYIADAGNGIEGRKKLLVFMLAVYTLMECALVGPSDSGGKFQMKELYFAIGGFAGGFVVCWLTVARVKKELSDLRADVAKLFDAVKKA
jgi:bacteriorhodopsin